MRLGLVIIQLLAFKEMSLVGKYDHVMGIEIRSIRFRGKSAPKFTFRYSVGGGKISVLNLLLALPTREL